jgi:hydrogenase nickel incorporation protein HypA/HybF
MPHEVDMTKALIMRLGDWWRGQPDRRPVGRVTLLVGAFTGVEPALLRRSFERQKRGASFLQDAMLEIRESPFIARCRACARDYRPELGIRYACPRCGAALDEIRSGRELKIAQVDLVGRASEPPVDG